MYILGPEEKANGRIKPSRSTPSRRSDRHTRSGRRPEHGVALQHMSRRNVCLAEAGLRLDAGPHGNTLPEDAALTESADQHNCRWGVTKVPDAP
eukprot:5055762-Pyramimonas_sp.AAC.1